MIEGVGFGDNVMDSVPCLTQILGLSSALPDSATKHLSFLGTLPHLGSC